MSCKAEKQPSSLSLAERLAFFSSLSLGVNDSGGRAAAAVNGSGTVESVNSLLINGSSAAVKYRNLSSSSSSSYTRNSQTAATMAQWQNTTTTTATTTPPPPVPPKNKHNLERCSSVNSYSSNCSFTPTTPRSSTTTTNDGSTSSSNVTPTPMDCSSIAALHEISSLNNSMTAHEQTPSELDQVDTAPAPRHIHVNLQRCATEPTVSSITLTPETVKTLTPTTKRIRQGIVGKLILPQKFLGSINDRNNNRNHSQDNVMYASMDASTTPIEIEMNIKKIGKIKSPFIESQQQQQHQQQNQQQQQQHQQLLRQSAYKRVSLTLSSLENSNEIVAAPTTATTNNTRTRTHNSNSSCCSDDANASEDSGKENYEVRRTQTNGSGGGGGGGEQSPPLVVEMRKKLIRLANGTLHEAPVAPRRTAGQSANAVSYRSSCSIDERYARYFGLAKDATTTSSSPPSAAPVAKTRSMPPLSNNANNNKSTTDDSFMADLSVNNTTATNGTTPIAAFNANVRLVAKSSTPTTPLSSKQIDTTPTTTCTSSAANNTQKRRDYLKRSRAMTIQMPNQSPIAKKLAQYDKETAAMPPRSRPRPATLTEGVRHSWPIQRYEDLVVTKEELQTAAQEFDKLFSSGGLI